MVVGIGAQIVLDGLGEPPPPGGRQIVGDRLDDPDDGVDARQDQQLVEGALHPEDLRDEGVLALDDHVDGRSDEQLGEHVGDLVERGPQRRHHDATAIAGAVLPEPAQRMGLVIGDVVVRPGALVRAPGGQGAGGGHEAFMVRPRPDSLSP